MGSGLFEGKYLDLNLNFIIGGEGGITKNL